MPEPRDQFLVQKYTLLPLLARVALVEVVSLVPLASSIGLLRASLRMSGVA